MPQLDFSNPLTLAQVVWMAIIFGVLYYVLARYALPQVSGVLENRAERINGDLDSARAAKAQSDAAVAEITEAGRRAAAEAQAGISQAVAQAKAEAAEQSRVADERLNQQLAEAEGRIRAARTQAMGALRQVATETAAVVVNRLTGQTADAAALDAAIGSAMQARG
ncbi:MAG TPA: F0F1 ATP synthase subunit B' [Acetobacteraceae bacterium]